jgi:hypothetical protein
LSVEQRPFSINSTTRGLAPMLAAVGAAAGAVLVLAATAVLSAGIGAVTGFAEKSCGGIGPVESSPAPWRSQQIPAPCDRSLRFHYEASRIVADAIG